LKVVSILEGTWQTEARALQMTSQSRLSKLKVRNTGARKKASYGHGLYQSDTGPQQEGNEGDLIEGLKSRVPMSFVPHIEAAFRQQD